MWPDVNNFINFSKNTFVLLKSKNVKEQKCVTYTIIYAQKLQKKHLLIGANISLNCKINDIESKM